MALFKNTRKFTLGERVRIIGTYDGFAVYEGPITFIHPANGWLTIQVDRVLQRTKNGDSTMTVYEVKEPFREAGWFSATCRINEDYNAARPVETGIEAQQLVYLTKKKGGTAYAPTAGTYAEMHLSAGA